MTASGILNTLNWGDACSRQAVRRIVATDFPRPAARRGQADSAREDAPAAFQFAGVPIADPETNPA